jgi:hypothetical protein
MDMIFYCLVGISFLISISNWKAGLYAAVVLDILRDPVRKLVEGHSPWISASVAVVWLGISLGALQQNRREVMAVLRIFPKLKTARNLLVFALIPGALLSLLLYPGGYRLAFIGGASYLAPLLGFAIGFALAGDQRFLYRWMTFYTILNSIAMLTVLAEYQELDWPILGGINFEWIRHQPGVIIRLIAGLYRSPDIMGLHAAHVCIFSALLALRPKTRNPWVWIAFAAWGVICVLLAGRRKMIGMPIVFVATYYLLGMWLKAANPRRLVQFATVGALVLGVALMLAQEADVSHEYTDYATTLFTEGAQRSNEMIVGSSIVTLRQSGLLGSGLGSATQGRQHVRDASQSDDGQPKAWQEDGGSRLFRELGVPGILLVALAGVIFLGCFRTALRIMPLHHPLQALQIGITALLAANLASFAISHQQYSGDPSTGMMVCMFVGFVLSCPLAHELGWFDLRSGEGRGRRKRERGSNGVME